MNSKLFVLLAPLLFAGCGEIALITAPIWVPIEYGVSQSKVVQPVDVISASNALLSRPFKRKAKAKFQVTKAAITCRGQHKIGKRSKNGIAIVCDKGLKGRVDFSRFTTRNADISIGPKSVPEERIGTLSEVRFKCTGNYNVKKDGVDPFMLDCPEKGSAVLAPTGTEKDPEEFTVWIYPPK
jgi:hypothetical protein